MALTWDTQVKVAKGVILFNAIIGAVGFFVAENPMPFLTGLLFGTLIVILNFRLLSLTVEKAVRMPPHRAQVYTASRYFIRYALTGAVVYISIQAEHIHVLGTIIALLSLKFVILKTELFNDKQYFKNIFTKERRKRDGGFRSKGRS